MAARRIKNVSINWTALAERVPENQKSSFTAFKTKSDGYLRRMMANPEEPPKIDWAFYKSRVPVAGMVDSFQKQYETLKIPYPADTVTSQIEAQEKEVLKQIQDYVVKSNSRIAEYESELARLRALLPFELMTMEDFKDSYPDLALDPINKPTYWPHNPEEQPDYDDPKAQQEEEHH